MTRGRLALIKILQRTTARDVAARCKVTPCRVSSWLAGDSRPNDTARVALEANYRIVASAWDEPAVR